MREHLGRIRASIAGMRGATGANSKHKMPPMRSACSGEIKSRASRSRSDQRYAAFTSRVGGWRCQRCHSGGPDHQGPVVVLDIKGENFAVTRRHHEELGRKVAPILLVLDEFVRMGRMAQIMNVAGVEALFVTQDTGQAEKAYGPTDARSIFCSCITKRVFNLSDIEATEWGAHHLGEGTVYSQQIREGKARTRGGIFPTRSSVRSS